MCLIRPPAMMWASGPSTCHRQPSSSSRASIDWGRSSQTNWRSVLGWSAARCCLGEGPGRRSLDFSDGGVSVRDSAGGDAVGVDVVVGESRFWGEAVRGLSRIVLGIPARSRQSSAHAVTRCPANGTSRGRFSTQTALPSGDCVRVEPASGVACAESCCGGSICGDSATMRASTGSSSAASMMAVSQNEVQVSPRVRDVDSRAVNAVQ